MTDSFGTSELALLDFTKASFMVCKECHALREAVSSDKLTRIEALFKA